MNQSSTSIMLVLALSVSACSSDPAPATDSGVIFDAGLDAGAVDCTGRPVDGPSPRGELTGVLDGVRGRIVVYGGNTAAPVMCMPVYALVDELWAFHLDCASWERLTPAGGPGVRARQSTTLDTSRNRMLLFAGRLRMSDGFGSYQNFSDLWAFDLATDTWSEVATNGGPPAPRSSSIIQYDAARDRIIVFGGNDSTSGVVLNGLGDTWSLDLATNTWTEITSAGPPPRLFHASALMGDHIVIFGGTPNFDGPFYDDTWAFDLTTDTWSEIATTGELPTPRFGAEAFHDATGNRFMIAFGHDGTPMGNRNDVYALNLATNVWSVVRPGDAFGGTPGGACMFPSDFTAPEDGAPERRYSFVAVQDAARGFVMGGKTDCGVVNDVVALDLAAGTWSPLRPTTGGEACNRSGRLGCTTLCY